MKELKVIFTRLKKSKVFENFSVLTISSLLIQLVTVLAIMKIARHLLPEDFGKYSFIVALSGIYLTISSFGARNVIIKAIAVKPELNNKIFYTSLLVRLFIFLLVIAVLMIYNNFFSKIILQSSIIFLLIIYVFFLTLWDSLEAVSYGFQMMKLPSMINVTASLIWLATVFLLQDKYLAVYYILLATVSIQVIKTLIYFSLLLNSKAILLNFYFNRDFSKTFISKSLPFFFLSIFTLISTQLPLIYLEHNSNADQIAFFNIANRIMSPMQLFIFALFSSFFPTLAKLFKTDKQKFDRLVDGMFYGIVLSGVFFSLILSVFSKLIVGILFGQQYLSAAPVVSILCWYTVLYTVFCFIGTVLAAVNKQKLLSFLSFYYACVSVPCLLIGSKFGAFGLSIGFVITGLLNLTYHIFWLQKSISFRWQSSEMAVLTLLFFVSIGISIYFISSSILFKMLTIPILFILGLFAFRKLKYKFKFNTSNNENLQPDVEFSGVNSL